MIEIYLLEYLDAFARLGTLSAASEELLISQPALSRSMQKLEQEIGVPIFNREKNRMSLNENGKLAAEFAARILAEDKNMVTMVQAFDRSHRTISLLCCAPYPMRTLTPLLQQLYPEMTITTKLSEESQFASQLKEKTNLLAVFHEKPQDKELSSAVCGKERLMISVPPAHPLAQLSSVTFEDLNDVPMLLYTQIGFWYQLCMQKIARPHFLKQDSRETFLEIANSSAFPTFFTQEFEDVAEHKIKGRKFIPIDDPDATVTYYLACRKKDREIFDPIFTHLPKTK